MVIYKITNKVNGKVYIGQTTVPLELRWKHHCKIKTKRCCPLIRAAIEKYGPDNFDISVLQLCNSKVELNIQEAFWIAQYKSFGQGYNLTSGGDRAELAEESKKKISNALKGRPTGRKGKPSGQVAWNKGKPWSAEMKAKLSLAQINSTVPKAPRKPITKETRQKMSIARLGKSCPKLSKPIICLNTGVSYESGRAAAKSLDLSPSKICLVLKGLRKHTKGYRFSYQPQEKTC